MKQYRWLMALVVSALLFAFLGQAAFSEGDALGDPTYTEVWDGRGTDSLDCENPDANRLGVSGDGWIHWIFATKGDSTYAELTLGGTGSGTYEPGEPLNANVWHFYTPYFALDGLTATIDLFGGEPGTGGGLVISDFCPGDEQTLEVTKTANATFDREHFWDIDKTVETENEEFLDGTPKIWLYIDDSGDETATWTVDVTYEDYEDSNFVVSGEITIENISASELTKSVTAIVDDLGVSGYDDIDLACTSSLGGAFTNADLPRDIAFGEIWTCTYSETLDGAEQGDFGTNEVSVSVAGDPYSPYTATDPWEFDEPENETNKTVNIEDVSDLFGVVVLGSVTAPNGDTFT